MTFDRMNYESVELSKEEKNTISNTIKILTLLQDEMRENQYDEIVCGGGMAVNYYDIPEIIESLKIIKNVEKIC